jgi:hypothetical protein
MDRSTSVIHAYTEKAPQGAFFVAVVSNIIVVKKAHSGVLFLY